MLEGAKKGQTVGMSCCCKICRDKTVTYNTDEGQKGMSLRLNCCEFCKYSCCRYNIVRIHHLKYLSIDLL